MTHLFHRFDSLDLDCKTGVCKMRKWKADADGGWRMAMAMAEGGRRKAEGGRRKAEGGK